MKKIDYIVKTISPVTFAEKSNDSLLYTTKPYIPGSALRGALASIYLNDVADKALAHEDDVFFDLFLGGAVKFLPAYPMGRLEGNTAMPIKLPLSLMKSKDGRKLQDLATGGKAQPGFKKENGFAVMDGDKLYKVSTDILVEFHMARNSDQERYLGSSIEGHVFNYEYIQPRQAFKGTILVEDQLSETAVIKLLELLQQASNLRLGRSKSAQYGACSLEACPIKEYKPVPLKEGKLYLMALSSYIPVKEWQSTAQLLEELKQELKVKGIEVNFGAKCFVEAEVVNGYVAAWSAKRNTVKALGAGSLLELSLDNVSAELLEKLQGLLAEGLGDRVAEGYGQFRLWNPLENFSFAEADKNANLGKYTGHVQEAAARIVKNRLLQEVRKLAKADATRVKQKNLRSSANSVFKRVEGLMDRRLSLIALQNEIESFKEIASSNLKNISLDNKNIYDRLKGGFEVQPYSKLEMSKVLGLDAKQLESLKEDLGQDLLKVETNNELLYQEYWLWFMRHLVKYLKSEKGEA